MPQTHFEIIPRPAYVDDRSRSPLANQLLKLGDKNSTEAVVIEYRGSQPSKKLKAVRRIVAEHGFQLHYRYEQPNHRIVCWVTKPQA